MKEETLEKLIKWGWIPFIILALAWWGFVVWAIYSVVKWVISK